MYDHQIDRNFLSDIMYPSSSLTNFSEFLMSESGFFATCEIRTPSILRPDLDFQRIQFRREVHRGENLKLDILRICTASLRANRECDGEKGGVRRVRRNAEKGVKGR